MSSSARCGRYASISRIDWRDIGIMRCRLPFPVTTRYSSSAYMREISRLISSDTRSPHPYMVSIIARLRCPSASVRSIASRIESISSVDSTSGRWRPIFGVSNSSDGLASMMLSDFRYAKTTLFPILCVPVSAAICLCRGGWPKNPVARICPHPPALYFPMTDGAAACLCLHRRRLLYGPTGRAPASGMHYSSLQCGRIYPVSSYHALLNGHGHLFYYGVLTGLFRLEFCL